MVFNIFMIYLRYIFEISHLNSRDMKCLIFRMNRYLRKVVSAFTIQNQHVNKTTKGRNTAFSLKSMFL